ncbi:MAG: AAA family ATPase, partial [Thermoplasmata archaeon]|nr:AAA family ATPase [Thermoplasmata archaeon]
MAAASAGLPGGEPRVSTGNVGLDAMLDGGLVARRPYLIVGPSGTGKTTLALQFLCAGVRNGERTLLVTLEEPPNEVRANHRGLAPELGKVDVFDAIPDVMRYERAPFKDIAAVRSATPFERVADNIRRTPELTSIEVTITALEQMLRSEVQRHAYTRIVIDSLTALQYFCMKGFDVVAGAQTFLRFLSDLRVTTILTVEAPLEDVETPERMLARGEMRLFRWELDDMTVRAIGVEKFRGSSHDIRLHPYRIGPTGLDINLAVTISRDTRMILQEVTPLAPGSVPPVPVASIPSTLDVLSEELRDLVLVGAETGAIRTELEAALASARRGDSEHATERLLRAVALGATLPEHLPAAATHPDSEIAMALHRLVARAESSRGGAPPVRVPEPPILTARLAKILVDLKPTTPVEPPIAVSAPAIPPPKPTIAPIAATLPVVSAAPTQIPPVPPGIPPSHAPAELAAPTAGEPAATPRPPHAGRASPPPLPQAVHRPGPTPATAPTPPPIPPAR